nr:quinone-dependent dihydroorotate dehydrogenase [Actinomycetota bacterium]
MGWYSAVGRPAFLSLQPEAAHRVANILLALPLPWERLWHMPDDTALATTMAGIELSNPVGLAAGVDKTC